MCRVLAERNPQRYHQINRSLRIAGHSTSIRLEAAFWGMLDEIADAQGLSTVKLIAALHDEAIELNNGMANFASVLRTTCLLYAREQASR